MSDDACSELDLDECDVDRAYERCQRLCPTAATEEYRAGWREAAIHFHMILTHHTAPAYEDAGEAGSADYSITDD